MQWEVIYKHFKIDLEITQNIGLPAYKCQHSQTGNIPYATETSLPFDMGRETLHDTIRETVVIDLDFMREKEFIYFILIHNRFVLSILPVSAYHVKCGFLQYWHLIL